MFTAIADFMYNAAHIFSVDAWIVIIVIMTVIFRIAGGSWGSFLRIVVYGVVLYYFFRLLAYILPDGVEIAVGLIVFFAIRRLWN